MSRTCYKTTYNETGPYYSTLKKTMYVEHCHSSDTVSFYDEEGRMLLCVEDTVENNMLDAINRLYGPFKKNDGEELKEGVEKIFKKDIPDWDAANPRPVIKLTEPEIQKIAKNIKDPFCTETQVQNKAMTTEEILEDYTKALEEIDIKEKLIQDSDYLKNLIEPLLEWPDDVISVEIKDKIRDLWCNKILYRLNMSNEFSKEDSSYCKTMVEIEYFTEENLLRPFTDKFTFWFMKELKQNK